MSSVNYNVTKYENRKLYCDGSYISFRDIKAMLEAKSKVTVHTVKGTDVTKEIILGVAKKYGLESEILIEYI